jgi:TolB-like protein/Tfp pilus assembly protein PilF
MCAGVANLHCGSVEDSLTFLRRALKLSPGDPQQRYALSGIAHVHMIKRNFDEAISWAERSLAVDTHYPPTYWMLAAGHAQLRHMTEARRYLAALQKVTPGATIAAIKAAQPDKDPSRIAVILEGLRLAGLPEKLEKEVLPSLAVLPFSNLSDDPEQDYFADGVVEDIITALSRFKSFAVIARNSSFTYKGRAVDVRQVAKELGVRYILEGSVRKSGNTLRIAAQLVDGTTGNHLWAQNFDGSLSNIFDFQDRITAAVAIIVEPQIHAAELERSKRERPGSTEVYDLYLRALPKLFTKTVAGYAETIALLNQALALEPDNAVVLSLTINALQSIDVMYAEPLRPDDRLRCAELVRRCLQNAAGDATVMAHCSAALIHTIKDYELGMAVIGSALEANPNNLLVVNCAGIANLHCGEIDAALTYFHRALTLSPRDPAAFWPLTAIAHVHMIRSNYIEALTWAGRSRALNLDNPCNLWMLIAANAHLDRMAEAHHHLAELKRVAPGITVARIWAGQPQKFTDRCAAILDGLRLAGLE